MGIPRTAPFLQGAFIQSALDAAPSLCRLSVCGRGCCCRVNLTFNRSPERDTYLDFGVVRQIHSMACKTLLLLARFRKCNSSSTKGNVLFSASHQ
ncbi:unnamed protein product [Ceratitis capitata]|uniref:(Mediterranean fruit fly) hypothetical protein n=1 Tax=Ceratitis capitata TaxID=7213 RepID=A0A811UWD5_CERCA|nr:unnamed protein product [Ceratitis capitata]